MGARKWQRGENGAHKSFALGVAQPPAAGQLKRKTNVWRRQDGLEKTLTSSSVSSVQLPGSDANSSVTSAEVAPSRGSKRQRLEAQSSPDQSSGSHVDLNLQADAEEQARLQEQCARLQDQLEQRKADKLAAQRKEAQQAQQTAFLQANRIAAQKVSSSTARL